MFQSLKDFLISFHISSNTYTSDIIVAILLDNALATDVMSNISTPSQYPDKA